MSILKANLKHLYQRRGLWFIYPLSLALVPVIFDLFDGHGDVHEKWGQFSLLIMGINVACGVLLSTLQLDLDTKPFAACLPGHRQNKLKMLAVIAAAVNVFFAVWYLAYPGVGLAGKLSAFCGAFFAGLTCFGFGVMLAFAGALSWSIFCFIPWLGFLSDRYDLFPAVSAGLVANPLHLFVICLLTCFAASRAVKARNWQRKHIDSTWMSGIDIFNIRKAHRKQAENLRKIKGSKVHDAFERFCLGHIRRSGTGLWAGNIYEMYGLFLCRRGKSAFAEVISRLLGILFLLLMTGYYQGGVKQHFDVLFFLSAIMCGMISIALKIPVSSTMLVTGCRKQRFNRTFLMAAILSLNAIVFLLLVVLLTLVLSQAMPGFTYGQKVIQYQALSFNWLLFPLVITPVALICRLIFKKQLLLSLTSFFLIYSLFCIIPVTNIIPPGLFLQFFIISASILFWTIFAMILRRSCRGDLVWC